MLHFTVNFNVKYGQYYFQGQTCIFIIKRHRLQPYYINKFPIIKHERQANQYDKKKTRIIKDDKFITMCYGENVHFHA